MAAAPAGVWHVLRHDTFRALWIAGLVSMIGAWMQGLGAAWLMTSLDRSPVMVGLVQAAQLIPGIVLAPIVGTLADRLDRRRVLMGAMVWQAGVTVVLAALTFEGLITPWLLVGFIFAIGIGNACQNPALSATLQDVLPRAEIVSAVSLNSMAMNLSRAIGPAIAGAMVAITGEAAAFLVNAATYGVFFATVRSKLQPVAVAAIPTESVWQGMRGGFRYVGRARRFRIVLLRGSVSFFFAGSAMTLMPIIARDDLRIGPEGFGALLGSIGLGAVITGVGLTGRINARFSRDTIALVSGLVVAVTLVALGAIRSYPAFCAMLLVFGGAWLTLMSSYNTSAQMLLPAWVRGRGLSIATAAFTCGMSLGNVAAGASADHIGVRMTLTAAGIALFVTTAAISRLRIGGDEVEDV